MRFDILTLFPEMFNGPLESSILRRAQERKLLEVHLHNIRDVAADTHKTVDDTPYGGGAGMVLKVDILDLALRHVQEQPEILSIPLQKRRILLLSPQGKRLTQPLARHLTNQYQQVTLICGHYEGFDERIRQLADAELSIGDYVLTGGELPALVIVDCIARLLPEVITEGSPDEESFSLLDESGKPLLEYPHYTRPVEYVGQRVPEVLLSGDHAKIHRWRMEQAKLRTEAAQAKEDHETI